MGNGTDVQGYEEEVGERPAKRARSGGHAYRESVSVGLGDEGTSGTVGIANEGGRRMGDTGVGTSNGVARTGGNASARSSTPSGSGKNREDRHRKLSCKECRRLKLKCDRVFPCQSCVKRGCGSLCPEGALTSGRGSRFILANTEQLHEKITELSGRVRELEDALESLQATCSKLPHPLLAPELRRIKTSQELYGTGTAATAQQALQNQNLSPPMELSVATKDNHVQESVTGVSLDADENLANRELSPPEVPPDILQLSSAFPFPWSIDLKIRKRIRDALPSRAEAEVICEEARHNALWQYNLDTSETFLPNLLNYCYTTPIEDLSPRRLALLLMVLSIGTLVDLNRPLGSLHGEAYHHLARAAICEIPLMEEPDFDELHALFIMIWYHLIFSNNKKAVGYAWNLMGFVAKLAQGLGLHRDNSRLKGIPEEYERRCAVFWELLNMDCRMSLSLGRPPSICLTHVDTKPPTYAGTGLYVPREEIVYHEWKNSFLIHCLTPMLESMISIKPPEYSQIIQLDKSVRDFDVPALLDELNLRDATPRFLVMQKTLVSMGREIALLQLHRRYFTEAMSEPKAFDLCHKYAPSVLATYLSASSLITTVDTLYEKEAQLSARFLHFWLNTYSAAVTLSLLISRAPSTSISLCALQLLERVSLLFRKAAKILPFSEKALPVIVRLLEKSRRTLSETNGHIDTEEGSNGEPDSSSSSKSPPSHSNTVTTLSQPFSFVHPAIADLAKHIHSTGCKIPNSHPSLRLASSPSKFTSENNSEKAWLPDVYRFSTAGLSVEQRYDSSSSQATPFIPSSPRVAEKARYNFDHGALTVDLLEETSYMAWF